MVKKIGIDLTEVARFRSVIRNKKSQFLKKAFSQRELNYCFAHKSPAIHLAGIFAAKEAVAKALGAHKTAFIEFEIRHAKGGAPEVWKKNRKLSVAVSITHTDTLAAAVAIG